MKLPLDTLDKKPKLYNLALLSAVVLAVQLLLLGIGGERELRLSCLLTALFFLSATGLLARAWVRQIRYNLYSYNTIIYLGFGLFTLFLGLLYVRLFFRLGEIPVEAWIISLLGELLDASGSFIFLSFPFLLVFSTALVISNLSLIRHEGFRFVNLLGIFLALALVGGEVLIFAWGYYASGSQTEVMIHDMITGLMGSFYLYFECMILGAIAANVLAARYEPPPIWDYIIVLGCGIRRDGTPTPLLRGRVDRALAFARAQEAQTGKAPILVLSGGQGPDECISEAQSMARYLADQGLGPEQMLLEERSTDTAENMAFSKALIQARNPQAKVAFSTTNYHVFRSGLKARRVKLWAQGMGCRSKWYFWPNAAVREFVGLLTQHRIKQGLILLGLVAGNLIITYVFYHTV